MALDIGTLTGFLDLDASAFDGALGGAADKLREFGPKGAALVAGAGAAIGGALAAGVLGAMDVDAANDKLTAQLGLTAPESARIGKVAGDLYAGAYGDSLEQVNEAIRGVIQNVGGMRNASDADLQAISTKVLDVATAFDQDLGGTSRAVGQLMKTGLATDANEAMDLIAAGFQNGADVGGDFLDTIIGSADNLRTFGFDGSQAVGLIKQGLDAGAESADSVTGMFEELVGNAADVEGFSDTVGALGLNGKKMAEDLGAGGDRANGALDLLLDTLRNTEDPLKRNAAVAQLFGEEGSALQGVLMALDPSQAASRLGELEGAATRVGTALNDNASANFESFKRQITTTFVEFVGGKALPMVNDLSSALMTGFGPALSAIADVMTGTVIPALVSTTEFLAEHETATKVVGGIIATLLVPTLVGLAVGYATTAAAAVISGATQAASWVVAQVQALASAAVMIGTFALQVAGWVRMAAAAVLNAAIVVGSWVLMGAQALLGAARIAAAWLIAMGPIGLVIAAVVGLVVVIVKNWDTIKAVIAAGWDWVKTNTIAAWDGIKAALAAAWNAIKAVFTAAFEAIKLVVTTYFTVYKTIITTIFDAVKGALSAVWNGIKALFSNALDGIKFVVTTYFNAYKTVITTVFDTIRDVVSAAWNAIKGLFTAALDGIKGAVTGGLDAVTGVFRGLPGKITGAVGNLSTLLSNAGRQVIDGFIDAVKAGFRRVQSTLTELTEMLPDWKGPAERDAVILRDAGQLVMTGFDEGLRSKFGLIKGTLGDVTDLLGMQVAGPGFVQARLGIPAPAASPSVNVAAPDLSLLVASIQEQTVALQSALRQQTRDRTMLARTERDPVPV